MEISLRGITKRFGKVEANSNINLTIRSGEVLGLLGENGAGKTTLMNILTGLYRVDAGEIFIDGQPVQFGSAKEAISAGIGMVHQHFMLVPVFSVAECVVLGVEPTQKFDRLDLENARKQINSIGDKYGLRVDPNAIIEKLPVGIQQRVEIIKVLFRSAEVIIFDEPTSVLTPQEVKEFLDIVRTLRDAGKAIVFITHKLQEVLDIADRITVLRGGKTVGDADPKTATKSELANLMVGRPVRFKVEKRKSDKLAAVLQVRNLCVTDGPNELKVKKMSFEIFGGECVGIAGVQGNGQTELVEALIGVRLAQAGTIRLCGDEITKKSVRARHKLGVAHLPEDRQRSAMIGSFNLAENAILNTYYEDRYSGQFNIRWSEVYKSTAAIMSEFDVRSDSVFNLGSQLSGGNQQRLVVGRELTRDVKLIIAAQPTRGVDVGSIEYIHKRFMDARNEGKAVLIVSNELDEILSLTDRILVMHEGQLVAEFETDKTTAEQVGLAMSGVAA